jgi:hypothetical protein
MSQCDFEQLALLVDVHNEDCIDSNVDSKGDDNTKKHKVELPSAEMKGDVPMETYVPVNFISDEVYAMIAAWEKSNHSMSSDVYALELASLPLESASQNFFEPTRHIYDFSPPKRFSRRTVTTSRSQSA